MVRENKMYNLLGMNEERQQRLKQVLAEMWEQSRPETLERVKELETAVEALSQGTWSEADRLRAEGTAHKLAGALGTYGIREGSLAAREVEVRFAEASYDLARLQELLKQVRAAVEK